MAFAFGSFRVMRRGVHSAHTAAYVYRYDSRLFPATRNFPDETNVTLQYGAAAGECAGI